MNGERFIGLVAIAGIIAAWQFMERGCEMRGTPATYSVRAHQ